MQAGSLKMFLRKAKKNQRKIQVQARPEWPDLVEFCREFFFTKSPRCGDIR